MRGTSIALAERPPSLGTGFPDLPPFLRPKREPRREWQIVPDILRIETQSRTQHENCWTIHYVWMNRVRGFFEECQVAHVNSRRYRQWLETYQTETGVPPHIQFGGGVVSGEAHPEFYNRWVAYALEAFF